MKQITAISVKRFFLTQTFFIIIKEYIFINATEINSLNLVIDTV